MNNNYISPEKILNDDERWAFAMYRHKGFLSDLLAMDIACGGPILVMHKHRSELYVASMPRWAMAGMGEGGHIIYPVGSSNPLEAMPVATIDQYNTFILVGISHRNFTVGNAFNGMIPTLEDTSHIVFRPRAIDGKIVTEAGREMGKDELLFLDVEYPPHLIETVKGMDKILDKEGQE